MEGTGTVVQLGRPERIVLRVDVWRTETKRNGLIAISSLNHYSFTVNSLFQSTSFSHAAASKGDAKDLLLLPVSIVQTAEIPAKDQKQGEFLTTKRVPHTGLTLAASKCVNRTEAEPLTPSGLSSLQTHILLLACLAPVVL